MCPDDEDISPKLAEETRDGRGQRLVHTQKTWVTTTVPSLLWETSKETAARKHREKLEEESKKFAEREEERKHALKELQKKTETFWENRLREHAEKANKQNLTAENNHGPTSHISGNPIEQNNLIAKIVKQGRGFSELVRMISKSFRIFR